MKFDKQALLSLAVLCSFAFDAEAFAPRAQKNSGLSLFNSDVAPQVVSHGMMTRLYAVDDEDEDDGEDPLGNGVDSVSWLPSVVGSKGSEVTSVSEVSNLRKA